MPLARRNMALKKPFLHPSTQINFAYSENSRRIQVLGISELRLALTSFVYKNISILYELRFGDPNGDILPVKQTIIDYHTPVLNQIIMKNIWFSLVSNDTVCEQHYSHQPPSTSE
jgi:hypothetical protein